MSLAVVMDKKEEKVFMKHFNKANKQMIDEGGREFTIEDYLSHIIRHYETCKEKQEKTKEHSALMDDLLEQARFIKEASEKILKYEAPNFEV